MWHDFNTYYIKREPLILPKNVAGNHNMCERSQYISSLPDILALC